MPADVILDPQRARILDGMRALPFDEIYEVGGSLRDELLGRPSKDVDFLVRGHSIDDLLEVLRRLRVGRGAARGGQARRRAIPARRSARRRASRSSLRGARPRSGQESRDSRGTRTPTSASSPTRTWPCATIWSAATSPSTRWPATSAPARGSIPSAGRTTWPPECCAPCIHRRSATTRCGSSVASRGARETGSSPSPRRSRSCERSRRGSPSCRPSGCARRSTRPCSDGGLPTGSGWPAMSARSRRRCPSGRRASACHSASSTQAYTVDEHILHVLDQAVQRDASLVLRLAAFWHDVGKPLAGGPLSHAKEGARLADRALRRLAYDNDTRLAVVHLVREHPYDEDREPTRADGATLPRPRRPRGGARPACCCAAAIASAAGSPPPAGGRGAPGSLRGARRGRVGQPADTRRARGHGRRSAGRGDSRRPGARPRAREAAGRRRRRPVARTAATSCCDWLDEAA